MRTLHLPAIGLVALAGVASARVNVGIQIGVPPPPTIAIPAPPRLVVVPGVPVVQYAPDVDFNYFFYGGRYYTLHDGAWFAASTYDGPWVYVPQPRVPRRVLAVPVRYYKVPPGHLKHQRYEREEWHEHEHGHGRGHGRGHHEHGHD